MFTAALFTQRIYLSKCKSPKYQGMDSNDEILHNNKNNLKEFKEFNDRKKIMR